MLFLLLSISCAGVGGIAPQNFARLRNDSAGRWWIEQGGKQSLTLGITAISYESFVDGKTGIKPYKVANDKRFNGNRTAWADSSLQLMRRHGFNTVGPWSDQVMQQAASRAASDSVASFYTPILGIGWAATDWAHLPPGAHFPDVFAPAFPATATRMAAELVAPFRDDPALLGWYSDNELPWFLEEAAGGDDAAPFVRTNLLWQFLTRHAHAAPGHRQARGYLVSKLLAQEGAQRSGRDSAVLAALDADDDLPLRNASLMRALRSAAIEHEPDFSFTVSKTYFSVISAALRQADPNHLFLGAKFTGIDQGNSVRTYDAFDVILEGAKGFVDAHSIDIYGYSPGRDMLAHLYAVSGVPWIIAECLGFRSVINLSGNGNHAGAGPIVPTQARRAEAWKAFARKALALPYIVGLNHFTWLDEPPGGRNVAGGEDSNYGLVSTNGTEYVELLQAIKQVLPQASAIHLGGLGGNRCALDTADFYAGTRGQLRSPAGESTVSDVCLTASADGLVSASACTLPPSASSPQSPSAKEASESQEWTLLAIGGATGHRLQNVLTGGCLHIYLGSESSAQLYANGPCSAPADWHWPPAWEHDDDCSLMQYCGYPNPWVAGANICVYNQSCATIEGQAAHVSSCVAGAPQQNFAFTPSRGAHAAGAYPSFYV